MAAKDDLGRAGEQLAGRYLSDLGFRVVDRNWRCRRGELDIIALDAHELVFVEVKARSSLRFGHPFEAVDKRKLARVWHLAFEWCRAHPDASRGRRLRVDAVAVIGDSDGSFRVEHLRDLR